MTKILKVFIAHQGSLEQVVDKVNTNFPTDSVIVAGGYDSNNVEGNVIKLDCDDSYCGLPHKMTTLFKFLTESPEFESYTHFHKLDEDMELVKEIDFELTDYMGMICGKHMINRNHHIGRCEGHYWNDKPYEGEISDWCLGGFSYIVSRKAAEIIGQVDGKQYPLEDVMVGNILENNQIYPRFTNMNQYYKTHHSYDPIKTYQDFKGRVWREKGIPKWIFRTGNESLENLHPEIFQMYVKQLENNPGYELFYFSDKDRLEFIKDLNDSDIQNTYGKLIPTAFKADLFKFVIAYTYGGICMDFSMDSLISLDDVVNGYGEVLARDNDAPDGLCVGFFGSVKETELLRKAIEKCVYNATHNVYGVHPLDVTGPLMFSGVYKKLNNVDVIPVGKITESCYIYDMADQIYIYDGDKPIVKIRTDNHYQILYGDKKDSFYYGDLWYKRLVYVDKIKTYKHLKGRVWENGGIPKWILRTGLPKLEELPIEIVELYTKIQEENPEYETFYFSDDDCEKFILEEWGQYYLDLYNKLIPSAYKADFWRYLLLYKYGGCYSDFTQVLNVPYDYVINKVDRVVVRDDPSGHKGYLYNALMFCKPGDIMVKKAIDICIYNIENQYYGIDCLSITGPAVLGQAFKQVGLNKIKLIYDISLGDYKGSRVLIHKWEGAQISEVTGKKIATTKIPDIHFGTLYKTQKHYGEQYHNRDVFVK